MVSKKKAKVNKTPVKKAVVKKSSDSIFKNSWAVASIVLAGLLILALVFSNNSSLSNQVSKEEAAANLVKFAEAKGVTAEVIKISDSGEFYEVTLSINGKQDKLKITKDGKNIVQIIPLETQEKKQQTPEEVPKSDRPKAELYVWGYCPYGVQAQGPFAEVAKLLEASADFKIVPYYAGHGEYEAQENKIESCIQKLEPTKYWDYALGFVNQIYPKCSSLRTVECDLTEATNLMKSLGINSEAVLECVSTDGKELNTLAANSAKENGVSGSPTIILNGVKLNVARNAEAYKKAICSSYNNAPAECGKVLNSTSSSSSGSC